MTPAASQLAPGDTLAMIGVQTIVLTSAVVTALDFTLFPDNGIVYAVELTTPNLRGVIKVPFDALEGITVYACGVGATLDLTGIDSDFLGVNATTSNLAGVTFGAAATGVNALYLSHCALSNIAQEAILQHLLDYCSANAGTVDMTYNAQAASGNTLTLRTTLVTAPNAWTILLNEEEAP